MDKIIMLGDSLIDWNYNSPYENYGKNGYKTRDVFWLLESREDISGDIGILLVGVNDFFTNMDLEKTQEYYKKIITELEKRVSKLILISLLPTDRKYINDKVQIFNTWLEKNYSENFLNLYQYFIDENLEMRSELTTDGIHLNHKGYEIFNKYLDKKILNLKNIML